jgi:hypothetical protein
MRHGEDPVAKMTQQNPRDSATSGTRSARRGARVAAGFLAAHHHCCTGLLPGQYRLSGLWELAPFAIFFPLLFFETFLLPSIKKYLLFNIGTKRDGGYISGRDK